MQSKKWFSKSQGQWVRFSSLDGDYLNSVIGVCNSLLRLIDRYYLCGQCDHEEYTMAVQIVTDKKISLIRERRARAEDGSMLFNPRGFDKIVPIKKYKSSHMPRLGKLMEEVKKSIAEGVITQQIIEEVEESINDQAKDNIDKDKPKKKRGRPRKNPGVKEEQAEYGANKNITLDSDYVFDHGHTYSLPSRNFVNRAYFVVYDYRVLINKIPLRTDVVLITKVYRDKIDVAVRHIDHLPEEMGINEDNILLHTDHQLTQDYSDEWLNHLASMAEE